MNPDQSQLLAQLQDIHGTGPPAWWPPAPGWWLLALVVLVLFVLVLRVVAERLKARRRRKAWIQALEALTATSHEQPPREYLAALNRLFRAVALKAFPGMPCARLQGAEWVSFIAALLPEGNREGLEALATGPYEPLPRFDARALTESARTWVKLYG